MKLLDVVAGVLGVPAASLTEDSGRQTVAAWSSLRHLQIVAAVEDAFGVTLRPRDIRSATTVGQLRAAVIAQGGGSDD